MLQCKENENEKLPFGELNAYERADEFILKYATLRLRLEELPPSDIIRYILIPLCLAHLYRTRIIRFLFVLDNNII